MARVTVEDCLEREENRFALVILAAIRTRQLMKGAHPLVHSKNKAAVTALREIAAGRVHYDRTSNEAVEEWIEEQHKKGPLLSFARASAEGVARQNDARDQEREASVLY